MSMIAKADVYEQKAEFELSKTNVYKSEARKLLDSASVAAKRGETDKSLAQLYIMQFNGLYKLAEKYTRKADSSFSNAMKYKDTASVWNKEAETYYLQVVKASEPVVNNDEKKPVLAGNDMETGMDGDTLESAIFVVQIGAGKMDGSYFEKLDDVRVIKAKDGIRRYVVGEFRFQEKEKAIELRNKMIGLGYKDAFIRTLDSLKK